MKTDHRLIIGPILRAEQPGPVFLAHPATESDPSACVVTRAYAVGELVVPPWQQPGCYRVWRGLNDVDDDRTVWHLDRVPDEPVVGFGIPLPVFLVAMSRSGEHYILQDRWGWFWVVPPDNQPQHITEEKARAVMLNNGLDLVGQSFSTWEGLHYFLQCRVTHRTEESST